MVGTDKATRPDITRLVWAYVKQHKLQTPPKMSIINLDDVLGAVAGKPAGQTILHTDLLKIVQPHITDPTPPKPPRVKKSETAAASAVMQ